jgi:hypothetical protein
MDWLFIHWEHSFDFSPILISINYNRAQLHFNWMFFIVMEQIIVVLSIQLNENEALYKSHGIAPHSYISHIFLLQVI